MIYRKEVLYNLRRLEKLFNEAVLKPTGFRDANLYGKLAILEAAGWLEQCIEDIFLQLSKKHLTILKNQTFYVDKIKNNHGFNYEKYLKNSLSLNLIGLVLTEKMETKLGFDPRFTKMQAALVSLTTLRGALAHSHLVTGAAISVQSVTDTVRLFNDAYVGLKLVERHLMRIKFN